MVATLQRRPLFATDADDAPSIFQRDAVRQTRLLQLLAQLLQHGMQYNRVLRAFGLCGFGVWRDECRLKRGGE
jgi:hypothetical protein